MLAQLGKAYYSLGYNDKAVAAFREALKVRPNDPASTQLLAESLINLGAKAEQRFARRPPTTRRRCRYAEQVQQMKPNSYEANNLVGRAALGAKDFAKAEQAFRKVLAQKPDYCYAMVNLGKAYIAQKSWADAEGILDDAAKCAPRMAVVYESLGFVIQKQKRLEEAIAQYEKALGDQALGRYPRRHRSLPGRTSPSRREHGDGRWRSSGKRKRKRRPRRSTKKSCASRKSGKKKTRTERMIAPLRRLLRGEATASPFSCPTEAPNRSKCLKKQGFWSIGLVDTFRGRVLDSSVHFRPGF